MLEYDPNIHLAIEPKPNEPMDHAYLPTIGHALALAYQTVDPKRVGGLIETAHALLAGLDPSDEMAFALSHGQAVERAPERPERAEVRPGQDRSARPTCAAPSTRSACWNWAATRQTGRFVGLDVKAMRTQKADVAPQAPGQQPAVFLRLVEKVRTFPKDVERQCIEARDYEALEMAVLEHLMGK